MSADLAARVAEVRERIATAARSVGRDPGEITIVAASKGRTPAEIGALAALGIRDFGENLVQEWLGKREHVGSVRWHLIGALQRNKVSKVVGAVALVHGLTRPSVAEAIGRRAQRLGVVQGVLLEVNTSGEPSKEGVALAEAPGIARAVAAIDGVRLEGFFTVASADDPARCFAGLAEVRDGLSRELADARHLSMGMSDDLDVAVAHGATIVRPGTALFGSRPDMP
jgi:pyridoxal phosphate enzyme (YggS family)